MNELEENIEKKYWSNYLKSLASQVYKIDEINSEETALHSLEVLKKAVTDYQIFRLNGPEGDTLRRIAKQLKYKTVESFFKNEFSEKKYSSSRHFIYIKPKFCIHPKSKIYNLADMSLALLAMSLENSPNEGQELLPLIFKNSITFKDGEAHWHRGFIQLAGQISPQKTFNFLRKFISITELMSDHSEDNNSGLKYNSFSGWSSSSDKYDPSSPKNALHYIAELNCPEAIEFKKKYKKAFFRMAKYFLELVTYEIYETCLFSSDKTLALMYWPIYKEELLDKKWKIYQFPKLLESRWDYLAKIDDEVEAKEYLEVFKLCKSKVMQALPKQLSDARKNEINTLISQYLASQNPKVL